jgi:hypothetical protein
MVMTSNGLLTDVTAENDAAIEQPTLTLESGTYECRDVSALSWNDQIKANKLFKRIENVYDLIDEYADIDDDDDDDDEPPPELTERWEKLHKRVLRFGFPDAPRDEIDKLDPTQITLAGGRFLNYMRKYGESGDQGNAQKPTKLSQKRSRKTSRA